MSSRLTMFLNYVNSSSSPSTFIILCCILLIPYDRNKNINNYYELIHRLTSIVLVYFQTYAINKKKVKYHKNVRKLNLCNVKGISDLLFAANG